MSLLDLVFPRLCVGCSRWGSYICAECLNKLELRRWQICPKCEKRSMNGFVHGRCKSSLGLDGVTSVFSYKGVMRRLIGKLKYGRVVDIFDTLVELAVSFGSFEAVEKLDWLVVAVPLCKERQQWQGFSQAEGLADRLANYFGWVYVPGLLVRKRQTEDQARLSKEDRKINVKGVFNLNPKFEIRNSKLKGKNILLVDDVWTTGATMMECVKVLKRAGASMVWGMTLAA